MLINKNFKNNKNMLNSKKFEKDINLSRFPAKVSFLKKFTHYTRIDYTKLSYNLKITLIIISFAKLRHKNQPLTNVRWFKKGVFNGVNSHGIVASVPKFKKVVICDLKPQLTDSRLFLIKYIRNAQKLISYNAHFKKYLYPKSNYKYMRYSPQRLLTYALPSFIENKNFALKNFYHKRLRQLPPNQYYRRKILAHYYLKYARYTLFFKAKKRRDIVSNFFSYDKKLLKLYAHRVEKFIYKRYPYKTQKYNTKFFFPNYNNYRFLFKNQIKAQHTFRWLYRLSYKQLVKIYKNTIFYSKRRFEFVFLKYLELRLDTTLYRLNIAFSLKQARQWVKKGLFLVNNKSIIWPKYQVNVGDIISPVLVIRSNYWPQQDWTIDFGQIYNSTRLFWRPIQMDQYPDHFIINERIPAGLVIANPNIYKVYHTRPLSIQFLTISLLKYS